MFMSDSQCTTSLQRLNQRRQSSLQAVGWGHPITTGLPTIDLFFSGELLERADADGDYRERLVRLPGTGACTLPPPFTATAPAAAIFDRPPGEGVVNFLLCQQAIRPSTGSIPGLPGPRRRSATSGSRETRAFPGQPSWSGSDSPPPSPPPASTRPVACTSSSGCRGTSSGDSWSGWIFILICRHFRGTPPHGRRPIAACRSSPAKDPPCGNDWRQDCYAAAGSSRPSPPRRRSTWPRRQPWPTPRPAAPDFASSCAKRWY